MSGAEAIAVVGLIDACIGITETIIDIGQAVRDAQGLPPKLRDLIEKIPQIEELLKSAHEDFQAGKISESASKNAQPIFKQCEQALGELKEVFRKACPRDEDNRGKRIWKGTKTVFLGRESKVKMLLENIEQNLKVLEQKEIFIIGDKLDELETLTRSLGEESSGSYAHSGSGNIIANEGGQPTNNVQGGTNNRQIITPGVYHEGSQTYEYYNHVHGLSIRGIGDISKETALLEAAAYGQDDRARRLLQKELNVDFRDSEGRTALHFAAQFGHDGIARALVSAGCDVDVSSRQYGTPLCLAALGGFQAIFEMLLEMGADAASSDSAGFLGSPLHAACAGGNLAIVARLIPSSPSINATRTVKLFSRQSAHETLASAGKIMLTGSFAPLHMAIHHPEVVSQLLRAGAKVDILGHLGTGEPEDVKVTPLRLAQACAVTDLLEGENSYHHVVNILLMHGANLECLSIEEGAFLNRAAASADVCSIELLVQHGAHVNEACPNGGLTPLMSAALCDHSTAIHKLLDLGADPNRLDKGLSALEVAIRHGSVSCVEALAERGANVNREEHEEEGDTPMFDTPLLKALLHKNPSCVELLAKGGADINRTHPQDGWTPLMRAACGGDLAIVRKLIDLGANMEAAQKTFGTAEEIAKYWGHEECYAVLRNARIATSDPLDRVRTAVTRWWRV